MMPSASPTPAATCGPVPITLQNVNSIAGTNVAAQSAGGVPFGSASLAGYCTSTNGGEGTSDGNAGIHCWRNINDGVLGNSNSWIPGVGAANVGVRFSSVKTIVGIRVSRGTYYNDRLGGTYQVSYSNIATATYNTPDAHWCSAGSFTRSQNGFYYFRFSQPISASAIRIVVSSGDACIDELEVYQAAPTAPATSVAPPGSGARRLRSAAVKFV